MSEEQVMVTDFLVLPAVSFTCAFCDVTITALRNGPHHMGTGDHCDNCHASYIIQWAETPEQTIIKIAKGK